MGARQAKEQGSPGKVMKPSEIPIYGPEEPVTTCPSQVTEEPGYVQQGVTAVRHGFQGVLGNSLKDLDERVRHIYETGKAHTSTTLGTLLEPENAPLRVGAIGVAGLLGYGLGAIRGRLLKRLSYASVGAGAASAAFYPNEAKQLAQDALVESKKTAAIAYNFINGVQPDAKEEALESTEKDEAREASGKHESSSQLAPDAGQSNSDGTNVHATR